MARPAVRNTRRPQIHQPLVVQLAREAEGGRQRPALGQAEGGVGQVRGDQRGARVVQRQADGAERVVQLPGAR
jgi:hypothetical protein